MRISLQPLPRGPATSFCRLVIALAKFEQLTPPDAAAQGRLVEDARGDKPRIVVWLAFVEAAATPRGHLMLVETCSSSPALCIEDVFVLPEHRGAGVGGALLKKAATLAHERGCGRMEWTALDWNVNAQRVYEHRLGAKRMSEWFIYRMTREDLARYLQREV